LHFSVCARVQICCWYFPHFLIDTLGMEKVQDWLRWRGDNLCSFLQTTQRLGEQGWCSSESARLPPMWPWFDFSPVPYEDLVCCWFSPCSEGFSLGSPVFLPPQKIFPNSSSTRIEDPHETIQLPALAHVTNFLAHKTNTKLFFFLAKLVLLKEKEP